MVAEIKWNDLTEDYHFPGAADPKSAALQMNRMEALMSRRRLLLGNSRRGNRTTV